MPECGIKGKHNNANKAINMSHPIFPSIKRRGAMCWCFMKKGKHGNTLRMYMSQQRIKQELFNRRFSEGETLASVLVRERLKKCFVITAAADLHSVTEL